MTKLHYCILGLLMTLGLSQASEDIVSARKRPRSPVPAAVGSDSSDHEASSPIYKGEYVTVSNDGKVHIHQKIYPNFRGIHKENHQFFTRMDGISYMNGRYYRLGKSIPDDFLPMWEMEEIQESDVPFVAQPVEAQLTDDPYEIVSEGECKESPYFSCGRLDISFPSSVPGGRSVKGKGSAAAIEQNILVTAAHNFLPQILGGEPNSDKIKADNIEFLHVKTKGKERLACNVSTAHCFIHPKWEQSFDPHYDIAIVFLNQSLMATQEEKDKLLRLHVLPPSLEDSIQVVGYPLGVDDMRRTQGDVKAREDRPVDAMSIVYHTANTERGNSGSPIVRDGGSLIGIHTRAPSPGGTMNRGVRIRLDLMPFLDEMVAQNQKYLADAVAYEAEKAARRAQEERQRVEEIEERGRIEGEARGRLEGESRGRVDGALSKAQEVALALMDILDDKTIANKTKLPLADVQALRASLPKS